MIFQPCVRNTRICSYAGEIFIQMQSLSMKFKPAEGPWECPACMVNNKSTDDKCVACTTSKPDSASSSTEVGGSVYFVVIVCDWVCKNQPCECKNYRFLSLLYHNLHTTGHVLVASY